MCPSKAVRGAWLGMVISMQQEGALHKHGYLLREDNPSIQMFTFRGYNKALAVFSFRAVQVIP